MVEKIYDKRSEELIALIIRSNFRKDGIEFFTPGSFSQQLGYMNRPKGYLIKPHVHQVMERTVHLTQEVLIVKSGKVKVNLYTSDRLFLESIIVEKGDVLLLANGGHGFEMIEDSEMIEVKQGPYCGDDDKVHFEPHKK